MANAWDKLNGAIVHLSEGSALTRLIHRTIEQLTAAEPITLETICELSALTSALERETDTAHALIGGALLNLHDEAAAPVVEQKIATPERMRKAEGCKRARRATRRTVRRG